MKKITKWTIPILAILLLLSSGTLFLFFTSFSNKQEYSRHSPKYYLLTPSPLMNISRLVENDQEWYIAEPSDGPNDTVTIAIFRNIKDPVSLDKSCREMLQQEGVVVVPVTLPTSGEAPAKFKATVETTTQSNHTGTVKITLFQNNYIE